MIPFEKKIFEKLYNFCCTVLFYVLQSLGILACVPAALLIFTLLVLLVYLVTRCCDRKPRNRLSIILLKCSLAILALVCCAAVAVGLYGNDDVHNGVVQLIGAAKNINVSITTVRDQVSSQSYYQFEYFARGTRIVRYYYCLHDSSSTRTSVHINIVDISLPFCTCSLWEVDIVSRIPRKSPHTHFKHRISFHFFKTLEIPCTHQKSPWSDFELLEA